MGWGMPKSVPKLKQAQKNDSLNQGYQIGILDAKIAHFGTQKTPWNPDLSPGCQILCSKKF